MRFIQSSSMMSLFSKYVCFGLLAASISFFNSGALAQSAAVPSFEANVGDVAIKLPIPQGFTEPTGDIPGFRRLGEQLTARSNRLMAFYISLADFRKAAVGGEPEMKRYFMVQTLRAMEASALDPTMFEVTKQMVKSQSGSLFKSAEAESQSMLDSYAKSIGDGQGKIKLGEVSSLGVFDEKPESITLLGLSKLQGNINGQQTEVTILFATNLVRVKNRIVYFYTYTRYDGKDDIEWAAEASKAWVTQVLALNR